MLTCILLAVLPAAPAEVAAALFQVGPRLADERAVVRTPGVERAVVLLHGLTVHPSERRLGRPEPHSWQEPDAPLVKSLSREADVFAFCYTQNACLADVVERSGLIGHVRRLRDLGYAEIVLVAHSAGGLVARQLVEDHPDLPIRRVVQVATPNLGSPWVAFPFPWAVQKPFLTDLTRATRQTEQGRRATVALPAEVEFVCVVANGVMHLGDGLVTVESQWTEDLARQRVPAYEVRSHHRGAVKDAEAVALLTALATTPQRRWSAAEVAAARCRLLGK